MIRMSDLHIVDLFSLNNDFELCILDSGASFYVTRNAIKVFNYVEGNFGVVYLGGSIQFNVISKGDTDLNLSNGVVLRLKDMRCMPTLNHKLILVGQMVESGLNTTFIADS